LARGAKAPLGPNEAPPLELPAAGGSSASPLDAVLRLFGMASSDPFYAVISYRNFKPM